MSESTSFLEERLRKEGEKVQAFFQRYALSGWNQPVYSVSPVQVGELTSSEPWRVREVLAHLVATESSLSQLISDVASGGTGAPVDFDMDDFNHRKVVELETTSYDDLLAQFASLRKATISFVSKLTEADLNRVGRHPFLGRVALVEMIKLIYLHNQLHLREVRRILQEPFAPQGNLAAG